MLLCPVRVSSSRALSILYLVVAREGSINETVHIIISTLFEECKKNPFFLPRIAIDMEISKATVTGSRLGALVLQWGSAHIQSAGDCAHSGSALNVLSVAYF